MLLNSQATPRARKLRLGRSGCSRGWARRFEEQVQAAGEALRHAEDELVQNLGAQQKASAYAAKWREARKQRDAALNCLDREALVGCRSLFVPFT